MVRQLQALKALDGQEQAIYFHSRERRKSLAGIPELFRSRQVVGTSSIGADIDVGSFVDAVREAPFTIKTAVRISGASPTGLLFEYGSNINAIAVFMTTQAITCRMGGILATDSLSATFDNSSTWPDGLEMDIVVAVSPGFPQIGIYLNGSLAVMEGSNTVTMSEWAEDSAGSFASDANGALPSDVTITTAPSADLEVIEPLSVYMKQVPQHFIRKEV